jgi:hypothetical protein
MARSDTRYSVYPAPKAVEIVGNSAPALNQAIECWAALLARATAENSRTFFQADPVDMQIENVLYMMNEWSLIAEAIKGMRFDPEFANPGQLLATAVEDAHKLDYIGSTCLDWGGCDSTIIKEKNIDARVEKTVDKLRQLDYVHSWAVILAVQWFWEHQDKAIDIKKHPWWTLPFRREWHLKKPDKPAGERKTDGRKKP